MRRLSSPTCSGSPAVAEVLDTPPPLRLHAADEDAVRALGARLAAAWVPGLVVYLHGDLGAGKTSLVRSVLRALGHQGAVRSPTYTLLEPYALATAALCHLDLYRLRDPEELEMLGLRDYLDGVWSCWIEWPGRGAGYLPPADLDIRIDMARQGRDLSLTGVSATGRRLLGALP